jgi:hypothetical protein
MRKAQFGTSELGFYLGFLLPNLDSNQEPAD